MCETLMKLDQYLPFYNSNDHQCTRYFYETKDLMNICFHHHGDF